MSVAKQVSEARAEYRLAEEPALLRGFELLATSEGGVAKLRDLIIALAIHGNLTSHEQSLSSRVERKQIIQRNRAAFVAEKGLRRKATVTGNIAAEPKANCPSGWLPIKAKDVFLSKSGNSKLIKGRQFDKPDEDLYPGYSASGQDVWLDSWEHDGVAVVLSAVGARCGKAFLAQGKWSAIANTHIIWPLPDVVFPEFAMLILNDESFWLRSGGAQPFVKVSDTLEKVIGLPPLAEQRRIVARVNELMALCDELEVRGRLADEQHARLTTTLFDALTASDSAQTLAANWQRIAAHFDLLLDRPQAVDAIEQTILQLAVRGLLVPQDASDEPASKLISRIRAEKDHLTAEGKIKRDKTVSPVSDAEKPFEVRPGWEWAPFGTLVNISSGITLGRKTTPTKPVTLPYLRVANVQRWRLDLDHLKTITVAESELPRFLLKPGDLLLTEGGDWDKVGRTCIWQGDIELCLHQNHVFKARGVLPEWSPVWAELYLNSTDARTFFAGASKQTTNLASINSTQLKSCPFPVPPLAEQQRIVARVEHLRRLCADLRERLNQARDTQAHLADALVADA